MNFRAFNPIILPIFFVLKMSSAYYLCCMYLNLLWNTLTIEANIMDPDQTAPKGSSLIWLRSSLIWIHNTCHICYQSSHAAERADNNFG